MSIRIGDRLPTGAFKCIDGDRQRLVTTNELFDGRRVVLVSVPGAFLPASKERVLPSYLSAASEFESLGVDDILCTAVNDPWVLEARRQHLGAGDRIRILADAHCAYHAGTGPAK